MSISDLVLSLIRKYYTNSNKNIAGTVKISEKIKGLDLFGNLSNKERTLKWAVNWKV